MSDLPVINGVTYIADAEEHVFAMVATRVSEESEGAEGLDGEGSAEPEVVGRGHGDDKDE